ncbi:MAG: IS4 family transposase [Phycisphaerae bacterium]|nr:IS4 family transposase [Phycisphaerae bacterium]
MTTLTASPEAGKVDFHQVAAPFLDKTGLPFADILNAADIEQAFANHNALFATDAIYSTPLVLWAFLAQVLRDGKDAACAAAVADIATYTQQAGGKPPSGNTGDYCRARAKLDPAVLRGLVQHSAGQLDAQARQEWLWHGRRAKLVDGFTFTMPDTIDNQEAFPQQKTQETGVGFPIARACAVLSLATAAICDLAIGPYEGKETGETALLRTMLDGFDSGDVAVFDRYYCSYMTLADMKARGVDVCTRLHQCRSDDLRQGRPLGEYDRLVTWTRPARPAWMSPDEYEDIPETLTLRMIQFDVTVDGRRTETITIVTTLTDPDVYTKEDIAELYGYRWNAELDIRVIKQTLGLDHARCKSPEMVERELWVTLLAYNLIRKVIATAAAMHEKQPRQIGFTLACQTILSSWMLVATGTCRDARAMTITALERIAANEVANRPGRIEPRVLKRRRHRYPLMTKPRDEMRKELA